jgi:hypothetical protein
VSVGADTEDSHAPSSNAEKGRDGTSHSREQDHHSGDGYRCCGLPNLLSAFEN